MSTSDGSAKRLRTAGTDQGMLRVLKARRHPPRSHPLRWLALGERVEPQPGRIGLYEPISADRDEVGVCCSGGGIRSAAFNLGALQTLQAPDRRVLQNAKYLSAVSGGSYIAAAFCMVAKSWSRDFPAGTRPDADHRDADDSDPRLVTDDAPPFEPGSPEEQYLRNHLGYLAPDGLARVYVALRMFAGLTVNTLLLGLPVLVAGLLVGWLARTHYGHMQLVSCGGAKQPACDYSAQLPAGVVAGVVIVAGLAGLLALLDVTWRARYDWMRLLIATWEVRLFLFAALGAIALMLLPWLAAQALNASNHAAAAPSAGTALGSILSLCAAAVGHVRGRVRDVQKELQGATSKLGRFAKPLRDALIALVVSLAGPLLLLSIALFGVLVAILTSPADATGGLDLPLLGHVTSAYAIWLGASAALLAGMYFFVDLNSVSLHPFYRRRLATAFALKRVWIDPDGSLAAAWKPKTGAAEARRRDFDRLVELSRSELEPHCCALEGWPMLVVCAAANVSDPGATPPGRAVASFTFSPRAIGGPLTGAVKTKLFETTFGRNRRRDVTLLAAVAMSGAALSPAMGKLTYRPLMFLLAMANIRLGVWVPNPVYLVADQRRMSPVKLPLSREHVADRISIVHRPRARYLWKEVTGRNRLEDRFLYVTDGGHYENLGLVELLRRSCRTIYCFDAGGGSSENALGDAIALARSELGVEIKMEPEIADLAEDAKTGRAKRVCARGRVLFPPDEHGARVEGTLFYTRSVLPKGARWELANYQAVDPVFPHHSTFDQFFDDQKFEAYRLLGADAAAAALALAPLHEPAPPPAATAPPRDGRSDTRIVAIVEQSPGIKVGDLATQLDDVPDIYGVVGSLVKEGRLVRNGSGRAGVLRVPR